MEVTETVKRLDDEIKIIKNEIQAVLLDIRESYLNRENPFNPEVSAPTISSVVAASMMGPGNSGNNGSSNNSKHKTNEKDTDESSETTANELPENTLNTPQTESKEKSKAEGENMAADQTSMNNGTNGILEPEAGAPTQPSRNGHKNLNGKIDLTTIAEMALWINEATRKLGYDKTEAILDVIEVAGYLKPDLKNIMLKLAKRVPAEEIAKSTSTRDYISLLVKLEDLVGMNSKSNELGLLSIFCQEA